MYFVIVFLLTLFTGAFAHKPVVDEVCLELKKIDPNASIDMYYTLVQKMSDKNLTTCECIKQLTNARIKKAMAPLFTPEQVSELQEMKKLAKENATPLSLIFDPEIDQELRKRIEEKARAMDIKGELSVELSSVSATVPQIITFNDLKTAFSSPKNRLFLSREEFKGRNSALYRILQNSKMQHELQHIKELHTQQELYYLSKQTMVSKIKLLLGVKSLEHKKWIRAQEAQADRSSIACGRCDDAYNQMVDWHHEIESQKARGLYDYGITHPLLTKRKKWATIIYNLKVAEEYHNKNKNKSFFQKLFGFGF